MPYSATVFNVLVASPSDVPKEREAISKVLEEWNCLNSQEVKKVLLPVMWETHSVPAMGARPQELINNQVVMDSDILVALFSTRLGSSTGKEESGTVEEIKLFLKEGRPVMIYYADTSVRLKGLDPSQLGKLSAFKESIKNKGLQAEYTSLEDLSKLLTRHLTIVMRNTSVEVKVDRRAMKEENKTKDLFVTDNLAQALDDESATGKIWLEDYSEKAFAVRGDSLAYREELKEHGGKWIALKTGGKGWIFSKSHLPTIAKVLNIGPILKKSFR